jgi:hypothetical protein
MMARRTAQRALVLDNEAVQALQSADPPQHRAVMAHLVAMVGRRRRGAVATTMVSTSVRVEAGWDRSAPAAAAINRFRVADHSLDTATANVAACIAQTNTDLSVADAHLGAAVLDLTDIDVVVLTSDPGDITRACSPRPVTTVRI